MQIATVVTAVGAVAVMILAWYHGDRGHQRMRALEALLLIGVLVIASGAVVRVTRDGPEKASYRSDLASVAVLPFVNMSTDRDQEYFGDGITEEILNVLALLPGLRVSARTSSFSFKHKELPVREIAQQLNVSYVLEGSVRKAGDRVRITAQLIEARSDAHLWSETFDRQVTDIFAVQEEIARAVATALRLHIPADNNDHRPSHTTNARAHEDYLRALYHWHRRHEEGLLRAVQYLKSSIREDPEFAPAYAALALTYAVLPQYADVDRANAMRDAKRAAHRALELDPRSAQAHAALGQVAQEYERDWAAAEQHYLAAQRLDPNYATAHQWRSELLVVLGRFDEAMAEIELALSLNPLSSVIQLERAYLLVEQGKPEQAERIYQDIMRRDPQYEAARINLIMLYSESGRLEDAARLLGREPPARVLRDFATGAPAARARAIAALGRSDLRASVSLLDLASFYLTMDVRDSVFVILNRAADAREPSIAFAANSRAFAALRKDPRFKEFRRKLRLPE